MTLLDLFLLGAHAAVVALGFLAVVALAAASVWLVFVAGTSLVLAARWHVWRPLLRRRYLRRHGRAEAMRRHPSALNNSLS